MDSLSQIVLGAAVGEVVLGKKIGNRALALGAIGGTIPDLDVIANPFLSPMQALDFHRGISHSLLFSLVAPLIFGGICYWFYNKDIHKKKGYRATVGFVPLLFLIPLALIAAYAAFTVQAYWGIAVSIGILLLLGIPILRYIFKKPLEIELPSFINWYWFFFWTFLTHILLDVCTTYGTQIFMPFSNMRVSTSSVSVVDPLYTIPFLIIILIVAFMRKHSRARRITNWVGIIISCSYLLWAVYNKTATNEVVRNSLKEKGIEYNRYLTSPAIFNTVLWSATIETDTSFLIGAYSKFDSSKKIKKFLIIPKNHHILEGHENDEHVAILKRFSDDYYTLNYNADSTRILFTDLRWGALDNITKLPEEERFPMINELKLEQGKYIVVQKENNDEGDILKNLTRLPNMLTEMHEKHPNVFKDYWDRIMGRWQ